jgi:uncharacterized protein with von Willebrand factor type A (vWA) domain
MLEPNSVQAIERIVEFCRYTRAMGFTAGVTETLDSLQAIEALATDDPEILKAAIRAEICSSKEEWARFDALFEQFWSGRSAQSSDETSRDRHARSVKVNSLELHTRNPLFGGARPSEALVDEEGSAAGGATVLERIRKTDFSRIPQADQAVLEELAERLLKQMSLRLSRRLRVAEESGRVDLRRTIRKSIGCGGELLDLQYKVRKTQQARIVILLDVSGSMNLYSLFLVRFAHALQKHFKRADTFIFSTSLRQITEELRTRNLVDALASLSQTPTSWSAGTKIGESLGEYNRLCSRKPASRETVVLILSDGWDTGEPEKLAAELCALRRRVKKVVWLNPLLGLSDYRPLTKGMAAALPHVDVFAPAHSLESLLQLEKLLM